MIPRRGRSHPSGKSRPSQGRPLKTRVLIVCEGKETEYNYLYRMKEEEEVKKYLTVVVKKGNGKSRQEIAASAIQHKEKEARHADKENFDDEVWCVMDVEAANHRRDCERALKLLHENGITPCLSNPAFEVWLLAHFERVAKQYLHADAVEKELNGHWKKCFQKEYEKADSRIYARLKERVQTAIKNARYVREQHHNVNTCILDCNSATEVYLLVRRLLESLGDSQ